MNIEEKTLKKAKMEWVKLKINDNRLIWVFKRVLPNGFKYYGTKSIEILEENDGKH